MISQEEIIDSSSPRYAKESRAWAVQMDLQPDLVLRPTSLSSLQKVVKHLCASDLDFGVRSGGVGSSSGRDIVLSLSAFDQFEFDAVEETVIAGAGEIWGDLDRKIGKLAPGFARNPPLFFPLAESHAGPLGNGADSIGHQLVVGARCPYVGVAGSILSGGFSWLSHEFGLMSDPQNMLDAQIVLVDGRVVWASEEPDLLWALRGGGGNFGGRLENTIWAAAASNHLRSCYCFQTESPSISYCYPLRLHHHSSDFSCCCVSSYFRVLHKKS